MTEKQIKNRIKQIEETKQKYINLKQTALEIKRWIVPQKQPAKQKVLTLFK